MKKTGSKNPFSSLIKKKSKKLFGSVASKNLNSSTPQCLHEIELYFKIVYHLNKRSKGSGGTVLVNKRSKPCRTTIVFPIVFKGSVSRVFRPLFVFHD